MRGILTNAGAVLCLAILSGTGAGAQEEQPPVIRFQSALDHLERLPGDPGDSTSGILIRRGPGTPEVPGNGVAAEAPTDEPSDAERASGDTRPYLRQTRARRRSSYRSYHLPFVFAFRIGEAQLFFRSGRQPHGHHRPHGGHGGRRAPLSAKAQGIGLVGAGRVQGAGLSLP